MTYLWHYTPWSYLPKIVENGALRGSNAGAPGEVPMLWFSANQRWEPTARKLLLSPSGNAEQLTFEQQADLYGAIRFGISADDVRLLNWKSACTAAGTPRESRRELERVGKRIGASPSDWFATSAQIPLEELRLQVWVGKWQDASSPMEMAQVWAESRAESE